MAFAAYKDRFSDEVYFTFEGEEYRLPRPDHWEDEIMFLQGFWDYYYEKLPPNPSVVIATRVYMTEDPQLDSLKSIYELDRMLNIEASEDMEAKAAQDARREM